MTEHAFDLCPRCGETLQAGFAHSAIGLSFVSPEKLNQFVSLDEDLAKSGLRKILPSQATYFRSYLCRECKLYLVDFHATYGQAQAKEMAKSMEVLT